jgi:sRNA-binding protein
MTDMSDSTIAETRRSRKRSDIVRETRAQLVERFPATFMRPGMLKLPLAIGIYRDIRNRFPEVKSYDLYVALFDYTRGRTYLLAMFEGAFRFDIDGNNTSTVTAEQAEHAKTMLDKVIARKGRYRGQRIVQVAAE